ncbi:MAG TPA: hypothetical protein VJ836_04660 [Candidatus Saccharimonadales bacterium]|nr:hypothetical protein [Candidatus Saccharimonadales bacterium]
MTEQYNRSTSLALRIKESVRLHKAEMKTLHGEIAKIKHAYVKKHGKPTSLSAFHQRKGAIDHP